MILEKKIFRAYDIRGEAFVDFDEDGFFVIAQAFAQYVGQKFSVKNPKMFVSGDGRVSMDTLWTAVVTGLEAGGAVVTWGGTLPTPINYYAFHEGDFDGAIQISASHNPAQDNGLKLTDKNGAVCGEEIQKIRALAECSTCRTVPEHIGVCKENCKKVDFSLSYAEKICGLLLEKSQEKKIVIDAGNGVSGLFYPEVFRKCGYEVVELYCDLDTTFPHHQPDPERIENLQCLIAAVKKENADYGLAFDGDGDRVGIVLSDGTVLSADKILYGLAVDFLSRNPGEKIVIDAMSSDTLARKISEKEGEVVWSKTGHSNIEQAMHTQNIRLGGEQSGHFMLGEEFYGHDDACLAGLRFLSAIEKIPGILSDIQNEWPGMKEFSEKLSAPDEKKFEILEKFSEEILKKYPEASTLDGVRISYGDDEWAIVRCSNTSPKIAIRIEARTEALLEKRKEELLGIMMPFFS